MVFLASRGVAVDPLEERITRIEENMKKLMSWIEESFMKMTAEIHIMKTQNAVKIDEHVHDDDIHSVSPRIDQPLNVTNLEERIHALESKMAKIELVGSGVATLEDMVKKNFSISNTRLNAFVTELDVRMTSLESPNGANDNITDELDELNQRVDALEEDAADLQITNLDESVTVLEENIEGLNTDVYDLDTRVSDLGASAGNGTDELTIAFSAHVVISPVAVESTVVFPELDVNLGNGYNNETGEFTVPPEGAGIYFFFSHTGGRGRIGQFLYCSKRRSFVQRQW